MCLTEAGLPSCDTPPRQVRLARSVRLSGHIGKRARRVKRASPERRTTLTELSERIDLTLANLSILKTGKAKAVRFSTLEAICRELGCQPGDLLGYDEE